MKPSPLATRRETGRAFDLPAALRQLGGPELLREAASAFVEMYPSLLAGTLTAAEGQEWEALRLRAHNWKGASSYLAATEVNALAGALELRAAECQAEGLEAEVDRFTGALVRLRIELEAWLASSPG